MTKKLILVPLFFHALNILLVYNLTRDLVRNQLAAIGSAGFFALHRINFFVTYGITFTPDFTGMFFFLAAFVCYLKRSKNLWWLGISLFFWFCALFSKETAVVLPAVLMVYECLLAHGKSWGQLFRQGLFRTFPFWIIVLGFVIIVLRLRGGSLYPTAIDHPYYAAWSLHTQIRKVKYLWWSLNLAQGSRIAAALRPTTIQTAPVHRSYPQLTSLSVLLLIPFMAAFVVFVVRKILKGEKIVIFGFSCFFLALVPVLPLAGRVMQHNLYFPLLGLALLFGISVQYLFESHFRRVLTLLIVIFLFSTGTGVVNNCRSSWPVVASHISFEYLAQFRAAIHGGLDCSKTAVLIARTGKPDILWYTDGGNLFRVFGPCPELNVYFEDLRQKPEADLVVRLEFKSDGSWR